MSYQEVYHVNTAPGVEPKDSAGNPIYDLPLCPNITAILGAKEILRFCDRRTFFCGERDSLSKVYPGERPSQRVLSTRVDSSCLWMAQRLEHRLRHDSLSPDQIDQINSCIANLNEIFENCPQKPKPF